MSASTVYPHLTFDATGAARIGTTRYTVQHLATEHYHHGWSADELLRQHTDLSPGEVYSALTFFYDHYAEMVTQMRESAATLNGRSTSQPVSREELMRRRNDREA